MQPSDLQSICRDLRTTYRSLRPDDLREISRIVHVFSNHVDYQWSALINQHASEPILTMYQSDGWKGDVSSTATSKTLPEFHVWRRGKLRIEFALQRAILKIRALDGTMVSLVKPAPPIPLAHGQAAWIFSQH